MFIDTNVGKGELPIRWARRSKPHIYRTDRQWWSETRHMPQINLGTHSYKLWHEAYWWCSKQNGERLMDSPLGRFIR